MGSSFYNDKGASLALEQQAQLIWGSGLGRFVAALFVATPEPCTSQDPQCPFPSCANSHAEPSHCLHDTSLPNSITLATEQCGYEQQLCWQPGECRIGTQSTTGSLAQSWHRLCCSAWAGEERLTVAASLQKMNKHFSRGCLSLPQSPSAH